MRKFLLRTSVFVVLGMMLGSVAWGAASYPTSVKSFTTKVDNVDDVEAEHINSLQDEVVAIQTALGAGLTNPVVQVVNYQTGAYASGSTAMPWDDTIPQNTEGDEYMTLAITPKSSTNKLRIDVVFNCGNSVVQQMRNVALFQDSTANALAAASDYEYQNVPLTQVVFTHYMTAGTTSATTFKVRAGSSSGTTYFNGETSRKLGGVFASSITITEIKA